MSDSAEDRLATRVGLISLLVLGVAFACFVFLLGRIEFGHKLRVQVAFGETAGLREGAPFVVGGTAIGSVESIGLGGAPAASGTAGIVVTIAIDAAYVDRVPAAATVFITSRGTLSERYLELDPPHDAHGLVEPGPSVRDGATLPGITPPSLDAVIQHTWDNLTVSRAFLEELRPTAHDFVAALEQLRATLAALDLAGGATLRARAGALVEQVRATYVDGLGGPRGLAQLSAVLASARTTVAQTRAMLAALDPRVASLQIGVSGARTKLVAALARGEPAVQRMIDRARAALDKLDPMLAVAQQLADRLARGEGSLGRLMSDPEFPEDAKELGKILKRQPWRIIGHPAD